MFNNVYILTINFHTKRENSVNYGPNGCNYKEKVFLIDSLKSEKEGDFLVSVVFAIDGS